MREHVARGVVLAGVVGQPEHPVGVHGVVPARLERVRANLVGQADAPALLAQVEHRPGAGARDGRHGRVELLLAVALERPEHLAREALGVHAHEGVLAPGEVAAHQGDVLAPKTNVSKSPWRVGILARARQSMRCAVT